VFTKQSSASSARVCSENSCKIYLAYLLSIALEELRKSEKPIAAIICYWSSPFVAYLSTLT